MSVQSVYSLAKYKENDIIQIGKTENEKRVRVK